MSEEAADDAEPIEVVLSVGELDAAVVAVRELVHRTGALEVHAVVDRGPGAEPVVVRTGRNAPVEVAEGERLVHLPHAVPLAPDPPALPDVTQLPPLEVDPAELTVAAPFGGLDALADALATVAGALGGRSVVLGLFATLGVDVPLGITAREGEPPVLSLGEETFRLPGN